VEEFSLAQAKAQLSNVVEAALHGRTTIITRRGKPVAKIVPFEMPAVDLSIFDPHKGSLPKNFKFDRDQLNARVR
jgi:prevent-host-death family protein